MVKLIGAGARDGVELVERNTFWTIPNFITVLRFCLVPVFVWLIAQENYGAAVIVLVVLGSTDWVDGYLARRLNMVSSVGKWLDPMADRLALIIVAITFVVSGIAPLWLVLSIVIPDAILIINALVLFRGNPNLPVSVLGKVRTALLLIGTPLLLLYRVPGFQAEWLNITAHVILIIGCVGHVIAAGDYLIKAWQKYREEESA
ncbi:CDP-alcohol phosphatidyltransferase family protein [Haematomicrobium sanguinis]|uniref:CDP-alcohol phosphatidyltransferase family protein n=1 Tax=Haematomicrobium sanguinis TaxID=479106 RepID=UPI0030841577